MKSFHNSIVLTLLLASLTTSIHAQNFSQEEDGGLAYMESTHCSHWSAYIPITIMVAAAIWFGIDDRKNRHHHHSEYSNSCYSHNSTYKSYNNYYSYCRTKYAYHSH